jgi:hypothetical protein
MNVLGSGSGRLDLGSNRAGRKESLAVALKGNTNYILVAGYDSALLPKEVQGTRACDFKS